MSKPRGPPSDHIGLAERAGPRDIPASRADVHRLVALGFVVCMIVPGPGRAISASRVVDLERAATGFLHVSMKPLVK